MFSIVWRACHASLRQIQGSGKIAERAREIRQAADPDRGAERKAQRFHFGHLEILHVVLPLRSTGRPSSVEIQRLVTHVGTSQMGGQRPFAERRERAG
jgi:hypothetical protein